MQQTFPEGPPSPPYPASDDPIFRLIVDEVERAHEDGLVGLRGAILLAAGLGWQEGHVEGDDECGGSC
jgi:hypothetical protein